MGIPKFFRWLSERYPLVNQMMTESEPPEFDNLYLDMNGIIHTCSHPFEDSTKNVLTEKEMFISVVHYVDRLLHIVKPRKLLFLAIDGVAPRAKMNQQRQRRFRAARDGAEALKELEAKGLPPPKEKPFDSNCITPGTEFMHTLSEHLHFFIRKKLSEDNRWKKIKVIFSGHDVPGEGEHKIMEYIRHCKAQPSWDPNQTHCMYGLDADLIMLSLASHEPHFSLLRENVLTKQKRGHKTRITGETSQHDLEFHFLHLSMVREYLDVEHRSLSLGFPYDLERIIDDFILMCFFVGNDFLPHSASFDIAEGGLGTMLGIYKALLPSLGGYLVDNTVIQWDRLEKLVAQLAKIERKLLEGVPLGDFFEERANNDIENEKEYNSGDEEGEHKRSPPPVQPRERALERMILESADEEDNGDHDWKDQYYKERFEGKLSAEAREGEFAEFHHHLRQSYLEGLEWVMKYYFLGCVSWEWFYPYFYAPLFSDLVNLGSYKIHFELGTPFTPYQQLLGVLPAASSRFLPAPYQFLMTNPVSPIIDFYPEDFKIDMTGKKNPWEGIVLVPFIDQHRLLAACATIPESSLAPKEIERNKLGVSHEMVYDGQSHGKWISPAPYLTDIQDCKISSNTYVLPPLTPGTNPFHLLPGAKTGVDSPSGFATLKTSAFTPTYVHAKVNIFGFPSKQDNLVLKLPEPQQHTAADPAVTSLIGTRCYVNWPYLVEAIIVGASDVSCKFHSPQHVYNKFDSLKTFNSPVNTHTPPNGANATSAITNASASASATSADGTSASAPNAEGTSADGKTTPPPPTSDASNPAILDGAAKTGDENGKAPDPTPSPASPLEIKRVQNTAEASGYFKKDAEWYQNKLVMKKGVDVGPIEVMLHVRLLEGMESEDNGGRTKKYSAIETQWPIQLYKPLSCLPADTRHIEVATVPLEIRFPPSLPILYMGPQYTGSLGNVQVISPDRTLILSVNGISSDQNRFGAKIAAQTAEPYYQIHQVARRLNISPRNLSKLTGSVYFEPGRFNLGLNIKFSGKNLQVPGYTRKLGDGPWEFSERAIQLIADYKAKFPRVFELLDFGEEPFDTKDLLPSPNPKSPFNRGTPLRTSANQATPAADPSAPSPSTPPPSSPPPSHPSSSTPPPSTPPPATSPTPQNPSGAAPADAENKEAAPPTAHQIASSIQAWLRSQPSDSIGKVPCGCDSMTREGIKQVEAYVSRLPAPTRQKVLRNVPASDVVGPREDPLPFTADFALGDRVVYALDNTPVPFGQRGTIVAVRGSTLDVVFDEDFVGGGTLDGACSEFRGKNVSVNAVYNISRYNHRPHSNPASPANPRYTPPQNRAWQGNNNNSSSRSPHPSPHPSPHASQRQPPPAAQAPAAAPQPALLQKQQSQQQEQEHMQKLQLQLQQQFQQLQLQNQQQQTQPQLHPQQVALQPQQTAPQQGQPKSSSPHDHSHHRNGRGQKTYKPKQQQSNTASPPQAAGNIPSPVPDANPAEQHGQVDLVRLLKQINGEEPPTPAPQQVPQLQQPQQPQQQQSQQLQPRQQRAQQRRLAKQQQQHETAPNQATQQQIEQQLLQPPRQNQNSYQQQPQFQHPQFQQPQFQQPQFQQPQFQQPQFQGQQQQAEQKDALTWQQQQLLGTNKRGGQRNSRRGGGGGDRGGGAQNTPFAPPSAPALFVPSAYNAPPVLPHPVAILPTPILNPHIHAAPPPPQMQHVQLLAPPPVHAQGPPQHPAQPHHQRRGQPRAQHRSAHPPHAAPTAPSHPVPPPSAHQVPPPSFPPSFQAPPPMSIAQPAPPVAQAHAALQAPIQQGAQANHPPHRSHHNARPAPRAHNAHAQNVPTQPAYAPSPNPDQGASSDGLTWQQRELMKGGGGGGGGNRRGRNYE